MFRKYLFRKYDGTDNIEQLLFKNFYDTASRTFEKSPCFYNHLRFTIFNKIHYIFLQNNLK